MSKADAPTRSLAATFIVRLLKIVGGVALFCIALVVGAVFLLNSSAFQSKMLQRATLLLSDRLQTRVHIDSISVGFFTQGVRLYGLDIEDRQQRQMLRLDTLSVDMDLWRLLHNEVCVTEASVKGVSALLLKESPDSVANYQFALDAFKRDGTPLKNDSSATPVDTIGVQDGKKPVHHKLKLLLYSLELQRIHVNYNNQQYHLGTLSYDRRKEDHHTATIRQLYRTWTSHGRQGDVDNKLQVSMLTVIFTPDAHNLTLEEAHYMTNNHRQRKNAGKPRRGFFDAGHLDVIANLRIDMPHVSNDSVQLILGPCRARDIGSGLSVSDLRLNAIYTKGVLHLSDIHVALHDTKLRFDSAIVVLPDKKKKQTLSYRTSTITGNVLLKEIAKPFAPVLADFKMPLKLQTTLSGNNKSMRFDHVHVSTADRRLDIRANGGIDHLGEHHNTHVHFHVSNMTAGSRVVEQIISQFHVKRYMMQQLHRLGTIRYTGDFSVLWRREVFHGLLQTAAGPINSTVDIDGNSKYVSGTIQTDSFMLGKVMNLPDIGKIACKASYRFDISKARTAIMRRRKGGKLPMGRVDAQVAEARYKKIKVHNIVASVESDGAIAEGNLAMKGRHIDVLCSFSFTNTSEMHKMKIKPGIKFHKLSDEDKAARDERRQQKKAEKAARREREDAEKAQRREQKAAEKAARKQRKAEEKARKKAEKA